MYLSRILIVTTALAVCFLTIAPGQGPLTPPPGPPSPQFKTLNQIESRTDIATLTGDANAMHLITQRGSYYLTGNITISGARAGIAIAASDVTLDLNGFTITGSATALAGIDFRGTLSSCRVFNGHIEGLPAGIGVRASGSGNSISQAAFEDLGIRSCRKGFDIESVHDVRVERARVSSTTLTGIDLNKRGAVLNSQVDSVTNTGSGLVLGIDADVVTGCQVSRVTGTWITGIYGTQVTDCRLRNIGNASTSSCTGIQGALTRGCIIESASGVSVVGILGSQVMDSRISSMSQSGGTSASNAYAISASIIMDCSVSSITADASTNLTGFYKYELATRCRCSSIQSVAGRAAGFRPSFGGASQTIDCGANSGSLNIGIDLEDSTDALIRGCRFNLGDAGIGIACDGTDIRIEDNTITGAAVGINAAASSTSGMIVRNRVTDCTVPLSFNAANWQVGPRISAKGDITSTNPWANFID